MLVLAGQKLAGQELAELVPAEPELAELGPAELEPAEPELVGLELVELELAELEPALKVLAVLEQKMEKSVLVYQTLQQWNHSRLERKQVVLVLDIREKRIY